MFLYHVQKFPSKNHFPKNRFFLNGRTGGKLSAGDIFEKFDRYNETGRLAGRENQKNRKKERILRNPAETIARGEIKFIRKFAF